MIGGYSLCALSILVSLSVTANVGSVTVTVVSVFAASTELCSSRSKANIRVKNLQRFTQHSS